MIINLTDDRRLSSDAHQYQLEKKRTVKGEPVWVAYKYYGSLRKALKSVPEQLLRESAANGITEVLRQLRTIERRLLEVVGE